MVGAAGEHAVGLQDRVARFDKRRVRGRESQAVGDEVEDEFMARARAMLADERRACLPERDAPEFALRMEDGRKRTQRSQKAPEELKSCLLVRNTHWVM